MSEDVLFTKIKTDIQSSIKSGDKIKLETFRMILAEIEKEQIDRQRPLKDEEVLAILRRGMKTRSESVTQFEKGNRVDLAQKEKDQIEVLKTYLPQPLTGEALKSIVLEAIATLKATSKKEMGLVMKTVMGKYGSQIDGKEVQTLVSQILM
ncbi:MAG: GatB/YqeY domain-containing protein [Chlamydiae bacterium]|nr:GatB/YqeY domain-containing protein [Chlamydiota bacterium]MBI3278068.1 GatB/YqeY domain-containing protein [Chlamydiota bacterium]